jgi:hypothetical protein
MNGDSVIAFMAMYYYCHTTGDRSVAEAVKLAREIYDLACDDTEDPT